MTQLGCDLDYEEQRSLPPGLDHSRWSPPWYTWPFNLTVGSVVVVLLHLACLLNLIPDDGVKEE